MPQRIQLSRRKGWRKPPNAVVVARPGKYGNPFVVGTRSPHNHGVVIDAEHAVLLFRQHLEAMAEAGTLAAFLAPLRGRDLCCWCPLPAEGEPDWCHGAVLLELADR